MNETKKRVNKTRILSIAAITLLLIAGIIVNLQNQGVIPKSTITVYASGTPDIKGNAIQWVDVLQNTTGMWNLMAEVDHITYSPGVNLTIDSNSHTLIHIAVFLNHSLASSASDARSKTRIYLNISGVCTNAIVSSIDSMEYSGLYWQVTFQYPDYAGAKLTWIPQAGTTYAVSILYQAYY